MKINKESFQTWCSRTYQQYASCDGTGIYKSSKIKFKVYINGEVEVEENYMDNDGKHRVVQLYKGRSINRACTVFEEATS